MEMKFRFNEIAKKFLKSFDKTAFIISFPQEGTTNTTIIMTKKKYTPIISVEDVGTHSSFVTTSNHKNDDDVWFVTFANATDKVAIRMKRVDITKLAYILADTMRANGIDCEVIEEKI